MKARIQMWGNSLALRLPKALTTSIDIHQDDEVELISEGKEIKIVKIKRMETLADLLAIGSPKVHAMSEEDKTWINEPPTGKEIIE